MNYPLLVVIDVKALVYKRYIGRKLDVKVKAEEPLLAYEIETLRTKPGLILPDDPPVRA